MGWAVERTNQISFHTDKILELQKPLLFPKLSAGYRVGLSGWLQTPE